MTICTRNISLAFFYAVSAKFLSRLARLADAAWVLFVPRLLIFAMADGALIPVRKTFSQTTNIA
jgi:hypothetical protein